MTNEQLWAHVCQFRSIAALVMAVNATLATVLVLALLFTTFAADGVSDGTMTVAILAFGVLGVSTAVMVYVMRRCRHLTDRRELD